MANNLNEATHINNLPCSFKFHEFVAEIDEITMSCHIVKMEDCLYLWVGELSNPVMNDLSFAMESRYDNQPVTTKIIGSIADPFSSNIAKRLSKKFGQPVYVSFNISTDNLSLPNIEKRIQEEFKACTELCF